jgi:hypothetical protein
MDKKRPSPFAGRTFEKRTFAGRKFERRSPVQTNVGMYYPGITPKVHYTPEEEAFVDSLLARSNNGQPITEDEYARLRELMSRKPEIK